MQVRLFAALRDAAGTSHVETDAATLGALLDDLGARFGEPFATRLTVASVLVDGEPVAREPGLDLTSAREVVLLPPFAGGA